MKKILNTAIWIVMIAGVISAMAFADRQHRQTVCKGFDLTIENPPPDMLIRADEVKSHVIDVTDSLVGRRMPDINLHRIRNALNAIPYVETADIKADISGHLSVEVELRRPIIRIENLQGKSYYIDENGWIIPVNPGHPARVVIASGYFRDKLPESKENKLHVSSLAKGSSIKALYDMALVIDRSEFLQKLVTQIWIDKQGNIALTPLIGDYTVKFGGFTDMQKKFEKLETFFRKGAGKAGWIDYRSVDLRYENQIICSKN